MAMQLRTRQPTVQLKPSEASMNSLNERLSAAWQVHQAGNSSAAIPVYREVLRENPDHALALCYLGIALREKKQFEEALQVLRHAVELNPQVPERHINLANALGDLERLSEAEAALRQALKLRPSIPEAWMNLANTLDRQGRFTEAVEHFQQAIIRKPDYAKAHLGLGIAKLRSGEFAEGWPEYEWRLRIPESQTPQMMWPRWDGSSLDGKSILLVAEQGLGDTIQFIRYAAELKRRFSCRVVAVVQKPLLGLLADCDGVDELLPRETSPPVCDFWSPLMSLPSLFGQNSLDALTAKIPYLTAQAERQSRWQRELTHESRLKIGIAWQVEKISPT